MSDLLKKFTADVDLATTKRRIINIGRALAAHFDEETAALRARAETAEAKLRGQPYELIIETYKSQLAEAEQRAEKAERERDAFATKIDEVRGYAEFWKARSATAEAQRDAAQAQVAVCKVALELCARKFRQYEAIHNSKGNDTKARANAVMAEDCEAALSQLNGAPRDGT